MVRITSSICVYWIIVLLSSGINIYDIKNELNEYISSGINIYDTKKKENKEISSGINIYCQF